MIEFRIKEKTRSLNESFRGDWRPRAAVAKRQRTKAMQVCPNWPGGPLLVVRLTRISPGTLDSDAVPAALKHVRDGVASRLRIDDASPLVEWQYHQTKGEAEVVVQIWKAGEDVPPLPQGLSNGRKRPLLPSERVSATLRTGVVGVVAAMAKDHGRQTHLARGKNRDPRPHLCGKNGCRKHRPCEVHDLAPATNVAREAEETFAPGPVDWRDHERLPRARPFGEGGEPKP